MIGILTFHKAINYGAVLQAYALRTAVESLGKECRVINYASGNLLEESKTFYFPKGMSLVDRLLYIYRFPMRAKTVKGFSEFLNEYLALSGELVSSTEELEALSPYYEAFIAGSDQVFNYNGTGEDFNFYLEFEKNPKKKLAYAPSFGVSSVDEAHRERVASCLRDFSALSVRETVGADIVRELLGESVPKVCDPTFLLTTEQWRELCAEPEVKKPYVLVYSFGSCHLEAEAKKVADEIGAVVVNINRMLPRILRGKGVYNAYAPSPREFLGLINGASAVVTNSFHGMALSILLRKEFYGFTNNYRNSDATNRRFETFGEELGLGDRIYALGESVVRSEIDYGKLEERIAAWRGESLEFLREAIFGK